MKANEMPKKIYLFDYNDAMVTPIEGDTMYVREDAFIENACEFLKDHLAGYDICEDDIERSIESFKLAMKL